MKAFEIRESFGIDSLTATELPEPRPGPGQVLLRMRAASLNYRDLMVVKGVYNPKLRLPFLPFSDGAGEVVAVGEGVTRVRPGEHVRVFPISNWTELDVWQYIARERLEVPSIYYAHRRPVVRRGGLLVPVTDLTPPRAGEAVEDVSVRFRTVGDVSCTCPVASDASTPEAVIAETAAARNTERGATRLDDQTSEVSMERRKREGYF